MQVDTKGLQQGHVGKRLRIQFEDGAIEEVKILEVTVCEQHEPCCGITYDLISTNSSDPAREKGSAYWTGFGEVKNFQVLGD